MLNLNSTIDFDVKKFFRWWKRELSFWVPERIKNIVNDRRGTIIVSPVENLFDVSYAYDGIVEPLARIERNESGSARYKALISADERLQKANVIFRLSKSYGIQKEISLPAAATENLYQVVSYELSRFSPFMADQAYFAVKPLDHINEPGQIHVQLILTAKKHLDAFHEDLKAMGITPLYVDYEGVPNDLTQNQGHYDLLPEPLRDKSAKAPHMIYSALIATVFVLVVAVFVLPVWFEARAVDDLEKKIVPIEREAKKIQALQLEIDSVTDDTRKLLEQKNAVPAVLVILNTLSGLIKDDTWLIYAQYSDGNLQINGESPAASGLISVLEASDIFVNARFASPVTQDNVSKLERFQITVDTASTKNSGSSRSQSPGRG